MLKKTIKKTKNYILAHKIISAIVVIIFIASAYWGYSRLTNTSGETRYVMADVQKETVIASITGSGQVSASNQIDIKSKASGDVIFVGVTNGQDVKAGTIIAQLDSRDAQKTVRDAQANLESAQLSLKKLRQPADNLSIIQAENALAQAQESKQQTEVDLAKAYDDGFNTISNAFIDLPTAMTGLQDTLYGFNYASGQWNMDYYAGTVQTFDSSAIQFRNDANTKYQTAKSDYDKNFNDYKSANRFSDHATIESLIDETYNSTKNIAEGAKSANNLIQFYKDKAVENNLKPQSLADTHLSNLNSYTGKLNTALLNLLSIKNTIETDKNNIVNAGRTIAEKTESLVKLKAGADKLDIESSQLAVTQKQNALLDAREKLADYTIRAPFDGTIAAMSFKKADSVSATTAVATLITKQKLAEISMNEVDVAKIKVGQKATLTFDAVDGLSIAGQVAEIDTIGAVTQGVVTYNIKIGFNTQDDRVKPGMSVSAAIITDVKQDVLTVPNSAVKTQGANHYVEMFDQKLTTNSNSTSNSSLNTQGIPSALTPRQQPVEIGLSSDTQTEIISGLKEGDQIVARTISATQTTAATAPSLFGSGGGGRTTGGIGR